MAMNRLNDDELEEVSGGFLGITSDSHYCPYCNCYHDCEKYGITYLFGPIAAIEYTCLRTSNQFVGPDENGKYYDTKGNPL